MFRINIKPEYVVIKSLVRIYASLEAICCEIGGEGIASSIVIGATVKKQFSILH